MDGYIVWKLYMAVKLHFTTNKFNVFNNRGNLKGGRDAFYARNDRFIFEKLSRKFASEQNVVQYFVANFAYGNDSVVYSDSESDSNLVLWQKRKQSISQVFENDLQVILLHIEKEKLNFFKIFSVIESTDVPELMKLFLGSYISIETMVILNSFNEYLSNWKTLNCIWEDECRRITKYKGFVKFDSEKLQIIFDRFKQEIIEL